MTLILTQVANVSFRRTYLSVVVRKAAEERVFANFQSLLDFDCELPMPHPTQTKLGLSPSHRLPSFSGPSPRFSIVRMRLLNRALDFLTVFGGLHGRATH